MNIHASTTVPAPDFSGLTGLCGIAAYYHINVDRAHLVRELGLSDHGATSEDILRAARLIGMRGRIIRSVTAERLKFLPMPALAKHKSGGYWIFGGTTPSGALRIVNPETRLDQEKSGDDILAEFPDEFILVQRRLGGEGKDPRNFGFAWIWPSILRYRKPLLHVLLASLLVQIFALITPLFFQVVIDKVLVHRAHSTLTVMIIALVGIAVFETIMQFLRTYALAHTSNRMDVELGQRLFGHLLRLPASYFDLRPAGQTVARVRELENIRAFITGQGLFSVLDLMFTILMMSVLFLYSVELALIVLVSIPLYALVVIALGPALQDRVKEKFNRAAFSQQFLVETMIGAQTVKASAVEPMMRREWDERLGAYVRIGFDVTLIAATGQGMIQFINKCVMALILLFGAYAVMDNMMSVGALVAFNMIAGQVAQPVLRLSQLWQDFQQVSISFERLGDILNARPESQNATMAALPPPKGAIEFKNVSFRYSPKGQDVLRRISFSIAPGETIGLVGPSGSGKSSIAKLMQRFYEPQDGHVYIDGLDLGQVDPAWLRRNIGVVLQENLLFARTIHDNIALSQPAMPRAQVMAIAELAGAHEFIIKLPLGYDTMIEERGMNLSGGQRQRIAIARGLATNPRILIFDEATSALDYESEMMIQRNMARIAKGRTVILIAHRLSTLRHANRIFVLRDGEIVESGSHDELLALRDGLYARLWSMQSGRLAL